MTLFKKGKTESICEVKELKTFTEKSRGLMGAVAPSGVFFRTRGGIHTFGMKFSIDVVIADRRFRVRVIKKSLPKGRIHFWNPFWENIFELPAGTAERAGIQKGDELELRQ